MELTNGPLTLDDLRQMDGEPVRICFEGGSFYALVEVDVESNGDLVWLTNNLGGQNEYSTDEGLLDDGITVYRLQPQWIPFTWRETTEDDGYNPEEFPLIAWGKLPENGQYILVTNGCSVWSDTFFDDDGCYLYSGLDATAWMPLPEPYVSR